MVSSWFTVWSFSYSKVHVVYMNTRLTGLVNKISQFFFTFVLFLHWHTFERIDKDKQTWDSQISSYM